MDEETYRELCDLCDEFELRAGWDCYESLYEDAMEFVDKIRGLAAKHLERGIMKKKEKNNVTLQDSWSC